MACTWDARGLVLLSSVALIIDTAVARSLQQGTADPGAGAAAALAVPWAGPPDPDACVGPAEPAAYRFMWAYVMRRPSGLVQANLEALVNQWMVNCTDPALEGNVVRYGHGPAVSTDPAAFGRRNPPANWVLADFGAWADFVKLRDLNTCLAIGEISGVLGQIRKFAMSSSQVVLLLAAQNLAGNPAQARYCPQPDGLPPAAVRYMTLNYIDTNDEVVREATDLFKQISDLTSNWVRSGVGPSTGPGLVTLPGVGSNEDNTATFGSYRDFKDLDGLTADLTNPAALEIRDKLHKASIISLHVAIRVGAADRPAERNASFTPSPSPSPSPFLSPSSAGLLLGGAPAQKVVPPAAKAAAPASKTAAPTKPAAVPAKAAAPASKTAAPSKPAAVPAKSAAAPSKPAAATNKPAAPSRPAAALSKPAAPSKPAAAPGKPAATPSKAVVTSKPAATLTKPAAAPNTTTKAFPNKPASTASKPKVAPSDVAASGQQPVTAAG